MSDGHYNKALTLVEQLAHAQAQAQGVHAFFCETMLMIAAAQPDKQFRITRWDFEQARGYKLRAYIDHKTGDTVYHAIPLEGLPDGPELDVPPQAD